MKKITLLVGVLGVTAVLLAGASEINPVTTLRTAQNFLLTGVTEQPQSFKATSDTLSLDQIETILKEESVRDLRKGEGQLSFDYKGRSMGILTSEQYDRMRIIAPIAAANELEAETLQQMMVANFHSALDARYAISNGVIYAVFLHPLSSLQTEDLRSALRQVAGLVDTFGSTYSSGGLTFGTPTLEKVPNSFPEI